MDTREIAKESAIACLSHSHFAATFRPVPTVDYKDAGKEWENSTTVSGNHCRRRFRLHPNEEAETENIIKGSRRKIS